MRDCDGELHPRARTGITLFNRGRYFEAHEELEIAWREERGKIRQLYQGILEAGVVYLHLQRGNLAGAIKVHGRSMRWLERWPNICRGIQVGRLRRHLDAILAEAVRLGSSRLKEIDRAYFQPIESVDAADWAGTQKRPEGGYFKSRGEGTPSHTEPAREHG
jgi:predicted metal-dependent hydrolase